MAVGNFVVIYYPGEEMETESKEDAEMGMEKETESERADVYKRQLRRQQGFVSLDEARGGIGTTVGRDGLRGQDVYKRQL